MIEVIQRHKIHLHMLVNNERRWIHANYRLMSLR
jgi:hypothetical protein